MSTLRNACSIALSLASLAALLLIRGAAAPLPQRPACTGSCAQDLGPDRSAYPDEVLPPAAALVRGWDLFQTRELPAWRARYLAIRWARFRVETEEPGRYRDLALDELELAHFLGSEAFVAGTLGELALRTGDRAGLRAAWERVAGQPCAALPDLLSAWLKDRPGQRGLVVSVLRSRSYGVGTDAEYAALLAGAPVAAGV